MPTHFRASCAWQVDSMLPRDVHTINPCFRHQLDILSMTGPDWQTLADDLATAVSNYTVNGASRQLTVKLYEIKSSVAGTPNRPKATKTLNAGLAPTVAMPQEIAVCLSYYGGVNGPHERGRLFLPYWTLSASSPTSSRVSSTDRTRAAGFVTRFADLGGTNVDWGVWSPTRNTFTKATNYFVDDEWDTVRRRGLKSGTRTAGTTTG